MFITLAKQRLMSSGSGGGKVKEEGSAEEEEKGREREKEKEREREKEREKEKDKESGRESFARESLLRESLRRESLRRESLRREPSPGLSKRGRGPEEEEEGGRAPKRVEKKEVEEEEPRLFRRSSSLDSATTAWAGKALRMPTFAWSATAARPQGSSTRDRADGSDSDGGVDTKREAAGAALERPPSFLLTLNERKPKPPATLSLNETGTGGAQRRRPRPGPLTDCCVSLCARVVSSPGEPPHQRVEHGGRGKARKCPLSRP